MTSALLRTGVAALFAYIVLLALLRLAGKHTIAQGTAFDFVLALVLGDLVDDLLWSDVPAAAFLVAVGTLGLAHTLTSWAQSRSPRLHRLVSGQAALVLDRGQPVPEALRAERLTGGDLEALLRLWGVPPERWHEVETARLEADGQASVFKTELERPATVGDVAAPPTAR